MKQLAPLEESLAKVFKDLPHLPKGLRDWLYENVWWLVIVGLVFSVFGVFAGLSSLAVLASLTMGMYGVAFVGAWVVASIISLVVLVATIVVEAMAIQPLKNKQKRGWDLLFLSLIISVVGTAVTSLVGMNVFGLIGILIGAAIGGYLLFEMRGHYTGDPEVVKAHAGGVPPKPE